MIHPLINNNNNNNTKYVFFILYALLPKKKETKFSYKINCSLYYKRIPNMCSLFYMRYYKKKKKKMGQNLDTKLVVT